MVVFPTTSISKHSVRADIRMYLCTCCFGCRSALSLTFILVGIRCVMRGELSVFHRRLGHFQHLIRRAVICFLAGRAEFVVPKVHVGVSNPFYPATSTCCIRSVGTKKHADAGYHCPISCLNPIPRAYKHHDRPIIVKGHFLLL
jgi:hypothetical protein